MEWIQCKLYTARPGLEPVYAVLMGAGVSGVQVEDGEELREFLQSDMKSWDYADDTLINKPTGETCVIFYISGDACGRETLTAVQEGIERLKEESARLDLGRLHLSTALVDDADWLNEWKKYYKPFRLGQRIVIKPQWEHYDPLDGDIVVCLNPGNAFGTGLHQSTQLCVAQLEKWVKPGCGVLDIGCGSGILSVVALLLAAGSVLAVDIDADAVDAARENVAQNDVGAGRFTACTGDMLKDTALVERLVNMGFQIVVANIVADVITSLAEAAFACLDTGGVFITSGIIKERLGDVTEALRRAGFCIDEICERDGWVCVVGVKG